MLTTFAAAAVAVTAGTTLATTTANAATRVDDNTVRVEQGDNLSGVASKFGTTVEKLVQDNNISDANLILAGQELKLSNENAISTPAAQTQNSVNTVQNNNTQPQTTNNQVSQPQQTQASSNNTTNNSQSTQSTALNGGEQAAKDWIASHESGGNYNATNGQYIGKFQLSASYLNGDYSPANQERVADNYVSSRYGSWTAAQQFWQSHGWY